jgi:hypothetical protein
MYTIEFQKRGLPHAHMLLWLGAGHKINTGRDIDKVISAEIPHPKLYPKLHSIVAKIYDAWSMWCSKYRFSLHGWESLLKILPKKI